MLTALIISLIFNVILLILLVLVIRFAKKMIR